MSAEPEQKNPEPSESPIIESKANVQEASPVSRGMRIFISGCNSLLGYCLIEELRNDHLEDEDKSSIFYGTLSQNDNTNPPPLNVRKIISGLKKTALNKVVQSCDVIIYNLRTDSLDEIRYVTQKFRESNPETDKTLILISSAIYWNGTKSENPIEDKDFIKRQTPIFMLEQKSIENEVLSASRISNGNDHGSVHPHKKSYVVCAGLIYGLGEECEEIFAKIFMKAWNYLPGDSLEIINDGQNILPTIHIRDLSKMISKILELKPDPREHPYFLAVDKAGPLQTQANIVESIAKKMGIDKITKIPFSNIVNQNLKEINYPITINLNMKTSDLLASNITEWHCENGFSQNLDKIFSELQEARGLRCVKVFLTGPPASGKTTYANWYFFDFCNFLTGLVKHMEFLYCEQKKLSKKLKPCRIP